MCGIIGYTGSLDAKEIILKGLAQLEYRGYDSAGLALTTDSGELYLRKIVGKVKDLSDICTDSVEAHCGIGHTRWATHGGVTNENAHPHKVGRVVLLHNGIIENYHSIQSQFSFEDMCNSETDTEAAAQLINYYYDKYSDAGKAIRKAVDIIEGSFAFCIMFTDIPGTIYAVRNVSPLIASETDKGSFIASDMTALLPYTKRFFVVPEYMILKITADKIDVEDLEGNKVEPEYIEVTWDVEAAQKGGYPHYMLKEIYEQPEAFEKTVTPRIKEGLPSFDEDGVPDRLLRRCDRIEIVACGSAMHAGMVGRAVIEQKVHVPVSVRIASEFRYEEPIIDDRTLFIAISQSGETIDTLAAIRLARENGAKVISVVNVKGSTIARESDYVIYTHAGPEIAVASTKAYLVQVAVMYLIAGRMMLVRGEQDESYVKEYIKNLLEMPEKIQSTLDSAADIIRKQAKKIARAQDVFYIGRGLDYSFSLEGALKLKEISYIHSEAYAAGELKHGTIALIEKGVPVIALATQESIFKKTVSNIREVKSRGAYVIMIAMESADVSDELCDVCVRIPDMENCLAVFPCVPILQLFAYYAAYAKGCQIDKPRNLAKSVTVE